MGGFSIRLRYSVTDRERYYAMLSLADKEALSRGWKMVLASAFEDLSELKSRSTDKPRSPSEKILYPAIDFSSGEVDKSRWNRRY